MQLEKHLKSTDPEERQMAEYYLKVGSEVLDGVKQNKPLNYNFTPYTRKKAAKPKGKESDMTVRKSDVRLDQKQVIKGEIKVLKEKITNNQAFNRTCMKKGVQYTIDFDDGIEGIYRPWNDANHYAQQGQFELRVKGQPDYAKMEQVMDKLDRLGIKATLATPQQAEVMYLQKQAYILKKHKDKEYANLVAELNKRSASQEEWIRELRTYWEKQLGVKDITKLSGYDPQGNWQRGFLDDKRQLGYRHQMRFDISQEQLDKEMKDYTLYHSLTNKSDYAGFIDLVLENNGAMVSTIEKLRIGIPPGGMSPEEDMNTGGATYFFTRIRKKTERHRGLYFKKDLLRRMDSISYANDKYGRTDGNHPTQYRHSTIVQWKKVAEKSSNETILKYSCDLLSSLDYILVGSQTERKAVIKSFAKHGVKKLPDGRKIEDIVQTTY